MAAAEGDNAANAILEQVYELLGRFLSLISCVADPETIVLGGGVSAAGDTLGNEILAAIPDAYNFSREEVQKALRFATRGNDAGMAGAAKLALLNLKKENE